MTKSTKKARQIRLPGTEDEIHPDIAKLGDAFAKAGSKHKAAGEKKKLALDALVRGMEAKGLKIYRDLEADPPISIDLSYTAKVKVKTIADPDDSAEPTQPAPEAVQ